MIDYSSAKYFAGVLAGSMLAADERMCYIKPYQQFSTNLMMNAFSAGVSHFLFDTQRFSDPVIVASVRS